MTEATNLCSSEINSVRVNHIKPVEAEALETSPYRKSAMTPMRRKTVC